MRELPHLSGEFGPLAIGEPMPEAAVCVANAPYRVAEALGRAISTGPDVVTRAMAEVERAGKQAILAGLEKLRRWYPESGFLKRVRRIFIGGGWGLFMKALVDRATMGMLSAERQ